MLGNLLLEMLNVDKITKVGRLFGQEWSRIKETSISPSIKYSFTYVYKTTLFKWFLFLELDATMYNIEKWAKKWFRYAWTIIVTMLNNYFAKCWLLIENKLLTRCLSLYLLFLLFLLLLFLGIFFYLYFWDYNFSFFANFR